MAVEPEENGALEAFKKLMGIAHVFRNDVEKQGKAIASLPGDEADQVVAGLKIMASNPGLLERAFHMMRQAHTNAGNRGVDVSGTESIDADLVGREIATIVSVAEVNRRKP